MIERLKTTSVYGNRDFLIKDWEAAHRSRETYASMRLGVLGTCLTIIGLVVSLGKDAEYPGIVGIWIVLLVSVSAGIRMLATVDRVVYIFFSHMAILECELGEVGFASSWTQHVKNGNGHTASEAFRIAMHLINVAVTSLVAASAGLGMIDSGSGHRLLMGGFAIAAVLCGAWNTISIWRAFNPRHYLNDDDLSRTREALIRSRRSESPQPNACIEDPDGAPSLHER